MTRSRVAAIGAGVGVAAASVITLLVVKGAPPPIEERGTPLASPTPTVPKTLPADEVTPKPYPAPADKVVVTALTDAKAEADKAKADADKAKADAEKAKAEQAQANAAQKARDAAIRQARQATILGQTALTIDSGAFSSLTDAQLWGPMPAGTGWDTLGTNRRRRAVPTVSLGPFTVAGNLDKAIVRRYLKRNIQKIQYCYERELLAKSTLQGTVNVGFAIEDTGRVTGATVSGVDSSIDRCINGVISSIEFPRPKGVGGVKVGTTFTFKRPS